MTVFMWKRRCGLSPARLEQVLLYLRPYTRTVFDVYPDWL